ncbi:MAG: NAD(P)H-dependent oxidoreductase subunit E [candidate division Zixibacteria bacterium]|nr:NAD(P)H-dependent oxidoreductase subunit E [candidate division Zixibacteria bacterium]
MDKIDVARILEKHSGKRGGLISILMDVQASYGYLPEEVLRSVAEQTGRSLVDIYGVATFYKSFSLKPRGKHLVSVCLGTACHVRGAPIIAEGFMQQLGIKAGETTADKEYTLETVNCLGACALGPIVVVDGHYFSNVKAADVKRILSKVQEGLDKIEIETDQRVFPMEVSCSRCNHSLMDPNHLIDGYPSIRVTVSFGQQHGWLTLSSLYGSYNVSSEYKIPEDTIADFFCPYCHTELLGAFSCPECGAPMVPMIVRGGGIVQICSRSGCKGHMLDLGETSLG